ncbi:uncharacterized protein LOC121937249 isoform X3 [Sceloporus undulatus]|uniref:uncharacterized protein LOC121937249 isoform X3 n=1 Tax=Sceloporus undulatus TaxID=8520 RepID=UPI001C4D2811|nr:uncharacterized protein LOC121937249 isoform X3 [Sceloporus undulatus]
MEPPDTRVLFSPEETPLSPCPNDAVNSPLPNLMPRHQELIPTPCGPIKPWSELSSPVKIYFCVTILSLLSVIGLTIENLGQQKDEDFPVSLIQLIGVVFCIYYVGRGILQENRQELIVFVLSISLVMLRSIVNFTVLSAKQKPKLLLCLCVLLLTTIQTISVLHIVLLSVGILWAILKVTCGIIAILKELKPFTWIFLSQNLPEVAYLVYLLYMVIREWGQGNSYALEAAIITCSCISVIIKSVLFWALFHVYYSFGQGLRERSKFLRQLSQWG